MSDEHLIARVSINPKVMVGKPVIRGTRLTVEYIVGRLAHGATTEMLLAEYLGLVLEDIHACLMFAGKSIGNSTPPLS
jgi:uncharacterized protein (DUF433 family)